MAGVSLIRKVVTSVPKLPSSAGWAAACTIVPSAV
jgi:hypothetical protein